MSTWVEMNDGDGDGGDSSAADGQNATPSHPDMAGRIVGGRYLIERELGRGGIGTVYLARDKPDLMSRPVVVKVLHEQSLKSEWVVRKFRQEVESLTRLDDPGIVGIIDAGSLPDGAPYLVMHFVEGVSLRKEIRPSGMGFERAADIVRQIGRTLTTAHEKGIIHRDLKPENVMLRPMTDGGVQVKVIDFGIAKVKNSLAGPSTITGAGVAGTIGYMSPEQLGAQKITPASDVYALGVLAYEMLTGIRPFNPETAFQLLEMQRGGVRVGPKDLRPAVPEAAQRAIFRALSYEPQDRYQQTREFGEALAHALSEAADADEASTLSFCGDAPPPPNGERPRSSSGVHGGARGGQSMELAHVLFTDIVAYSKLPIDHQTEVLRGLQEVVRSTTAFTRAQEKGQLICIPTGDGMALVFFDDPEAPARCALEISKALKAHPQIQLRMGIHCGPVNQVLDVNESVNVAGAGINMAQRVMDCGDAGHILLSKRVADDLGQHSAWQRHLHDLGETEVKHGVRMHLVNLYTEELGNPDLPEKMRRGARWSIPLLAILLLAAIVSGLAAWALWARAGAGAKTDGPRAAADSPAEAAPSAGAPPSPAVAPAAEHSFTYFLTPADRGRDEEEERFTGNEQFRNGSKFRFVLMPEQPGALYLLNQGPGAGQAEAWNVLFPTPKNNNGSSLVSAHERAEARIHFDTNQGAEALLIIWATRPVPELETIFKDAAQTDFEIKNPAQVAAIKGFLTRYKSPEPKAEVDTEKHQTTVRGKGEIFIRLLVLKHRQF